MNLLFTPNDFIIKQKLDFKIGDELVGTLRQKRVLIGTQLIVDFNMDIAHRLDHRLGLAAAVILAAHQATTDAD